MNADELENLEKGIVEMTTCPICSEFIGTPIFQCQSGHYFCASCVRQLDHCPSCRVPLSRTGNRALGLEEVFSFLKAVPCTQKGCSVKGPFSVIGQHSSTCANREIQCPLSECPWTGKISEVRPHVESVHVEDIININSEVLFIVGNPEGQAIDVRSETIVRTRADKIYIIGFWMIKGQAIPSSIMCTAMHVGTEDISSVRSIMSIESVKDECIFSCVRCPWTSSYSVVDMLNSRHNLSLNWETALCAGKIPPYYRENDQIKKYPQSAGLNLWVTAKIIDPEEDVLADVDPIDPMRIALSTMSDMDF
jgi:hypothetical protein